MTYAPSTVEHRKFQLLLKKLTPGLHLYRNYRDRVALYLGVHDPVLPAVDYKGRIGRVTGLRMIRSELFDKEYLVSYIDTEWLGIAAPSCGAIMSLVISTAMSDAPPQVYVPDSRIRSRSLKFRSILEHEIVHINQVILGVFPGEPDGRNAEVVLKIFHR